MTDLRRVELALAALGLSGAAVLGLITVDAALHHAAVLPFIATLVVVVAARAAASAARQVRTQRSLLRRMTGRVAVVQGHLVVVVPGRDPCAFCAGLLRPAVYVSEGTLALEPRALRAILAHEEHHRRRRDPLRLVLARTVADAFRPLPPFARLADRQAAVADLLADEAAVAAVGEARPLAVALARFDESGAGVAPERVDRLVRTAPVATVSAALPLAAAVALAVMSVLLVIGHHPRLEHLGVLAVLVPACVAATRAGACLRAGP
jgi:bla regulator protein blaR1